MYNNTRTSNDIEYNLRTMGPVETKVALNHFYCYGFSDEVTIKWGQDGRLPTELLESQCD